MNNYKNCNRQKVQYSFIVTLLILISLFYVFRFKKVPISKKQQKGNPFTVISYPAIPIIKKTKKEPQKPSISVENDEMELLDEVIFEYAEDDSAQDVYSIYIIPYKKYNLVLGNCLPNTFNIILIGYKIGTDGKIKSHTILKNLTNNSVLIKSILVQAYAKTWERKCENGKFVEYVRKESYVLSR